MFSRTGASRSWARAPDPGPGNDAPARVHGNAMVAEQRGGAHPARPELARAAHGPDRTGMLPGRFQDDPVIPYRYGEVGSRHEDRLQREGGAAGLMAPSGAAILGGED